MTLLNCNVRHIGVPLLVGVLWICLGTPYPPAFSAAGGFQKRPWSAGVLGLIVGAEIAEWKPGKRLGFYRYPMIFIGAETLNQSLVDGALNQFDGFPHAKLSFDVVSVERNSLG